MPRAALVLAVAALLCAPGLASADFIDGMTGYTYFGSPGPAPPASLPAGVVNFSVFENPGGVDWTALLGVTPDTLAGPAVDPDAPYIFFYQLALDTFGPFADGTTSFTVDNPVGVAGLTSAGFLTRGGDTLGFADGALVGPDPNNKLGPAADGPEAALEVDDGAASAVGVFDLPEGPAAFDTTSGVAVVPSSVTIGAATVSWAFAGIPAGGYSPVLFMTADALINLPGDGGFGDSTATTLGGASSTANLPVPNPEPSTLILVSLGGIAGALAHRRRREEDEEEGATADDAA